MDKSGAGREIVRRRAFISGIATATVGVAGCLGGGDDTPTAETSDEGSPAAERTTTGGGASPEPELSIPVRGSTDADVRVLVFEDFACPHCRDFSLDVVPRLQSEYIEPGHVQYEFHDFPIPVDDDVSWEAACAARAVQASEGDAAFFRYARALFENQPRLGPSTYEQLANEHGLDGAAVRESAVNREYVATVRADRQAAQQLGIRGTPTVVVGRREVQPTYDAISTAIDARLAD